MQDWVGWTEVRYAYLKGKLVRNQGDHDKIELPAGSSANTVAKPPSDVEVSRARMKMN